MKKLFFAALLLSFNSFSQDVSQTFNSTRIVNSHSTETLSERQWEYRIEHRFGDLAGAGGGTQTAFGFDQAADIRMAFEYGLSDKWMVGLARNKGIARPYKSLLEGFIKGRILTQNKEKNIPVSIAVLAESYYSYMKASTDTFAVDFFPKKSHRLSYATQMIVTRKMSDRLSLALMPTYVHRNYVAADDVNGLFSLGGAFNYKLTKSMGVILEYFYNVEPDGFRPNAKNSFAVGYEFVTNGHNFHINLSNARGFGSMQYVALTQEEWLKGQFRLGFSIARTFKIRRR
jgi:hypothetical protein